MIFLIVSIFVTDAFNNKMSKLLHAITCYYSTCYDNVIIRFVTFYYITLDLYYYVFVALNNPSSNTLMTDFFMLSYIASLPKCE